ncbi:MAG TPA: hypothetical protein PLW81_02170 [Thiobacillaceae bacterium]|nr:hypothetical protein [Thiobacillaceae bacterium]
MTACVTPPDGVFATSAQRFPDRAAAMGYIDRLLSKRGRNGDLIITDHAVRFVTCEVEESGREVFVVPHEETEVVYRDGNWLFLRSARQAGGTRQYFGFALHGTTRASGESLAEAALAELRKRRAAKGLFVTPRVQPAADLVIVDQGDPEVRIASVDRGRVGSETGKGVAAGAVAGVAVGLNPELPLILYPPAAVVLIVGGALIGGATGSIQAEKEAQRNALMLPLEDAVLGKALHEMRMGPTLAEKIEPLLRVESRWRTGVAGQGSPNCGDYYRDCAQQGILGVVEIPPARIEFRADKANLEGDQDRARQTLSIFQRVYLYSTLSGQPVAIIDVAARSDRHSLVEWRENSGAKLREAIREAQQPMPDVIAMQLQRSLDKLITFK